MKELTSCIFCESNCFWAPRIPTRLKRNYVSVPQYIQSNLRIQSTVTLNSYNDSAAMLASVTTDAQRKNGSDKNGNGP